MKVWIAHEGAQQPFLPVDTAPMDYRTREVFLRYYSIQLRWASLQAARDWLAMQFIPRIFATDQVSYRDWTAKSGTLMYLYSYQASMQRQGAEGFAFTHSGTGGFTSAFDSLNKFMKESRQLWVWDWNLAESRKIPESGTAQTFFALAFSLTQLTQVKVASPPAEAPVTIISVTFENNPQLFSSSASAPSVIFCPLKYSLASLQARGWERVPWWPEPSQYFRNTFVASWNQFLGLLDRMPQVNWIVSGQVLELPSVPLLLWQQLSVVVARSPAPHQPPPSKNRTIRVGTVPREIQYAPGLPSRQSAAGSFWRTLWQTAAWGAAIVRRKVRVRIWRIWLIIPTQCIWQDILQNIFNVSSILYKFKSGGKIKDSQSSRSLHLISSLLSKHPHITIICAQQYRYQVKATRQIQIEKKT